MAIRFRNIFRSISNGGAVVIITLVTLIALSAVEGSSQASRRKKTVKSTPAASATPPTGEPLIISRAEDFPDTESRQVIPTPGQTELVPGSSKSDDVAELRDRIKSLEGVRKNDSDEKQKRLMLNLDILTKSEQRVEGLRKQLFEMIEKESSIKLRLDLIDNDVRPEAIERQVSVTGSLRPEELRAQRKRSLDLEKNNLQSLMVEIQKNRANLEQNVLKADALVERLRSKLEKEIDTALDEGSEDKP